jgi:hypothetical protein
MTAELKTEDKIKKPYTFEDAMTIADDIFSLQKEKQYHPGAFVHGLILTLEATQQSYQIPQKDIAEVKRGVRRYLKSVSEQLGKTRQ